MLTMIDKNTKAMGCQVSAAFKKVTNAKPARKEMPA
jgi:hypothetical protein